MRLTGQLVCRSDAEVESVRSHLALHAALSRAEPGCVAFAVVPTENARVWQVDEEFDSAEAFADHQARAAGSAWGRATADIERRYTLS